MANNEFGYLPDWYTGTGIIMLAESESVFAYDGAS